MADGYVRRTAITRLSVDGEQRELLEETISGGRGAAKSLQTSRGDVATPRATCNPSPMILCANTPTSAVSTRELIHRLREFEKVRAGVQQTGTRSAHRTLVQSSGRELRYVRDVLHRASNALIDEALRYDCDVIAFGNLTHIRDRTGASWGHKWALRTLYEYVEYKAEAVGISVKQVGSAYTSKRCSECGFTADENRPSRNDFRCAKCESEVNANYNAAKNIGMRYVRRGQQSSRRTGDSQLALKSGTVTPKSGFTGYPDGVEAEFTDKPHPQSAEGA